MHYLAILLLLASLPALGQTGKPQAPPKPLSASVEIFSTAINLFQLPRTVDEAHRLHGQLRGLQDAAIADLEKALGDLKQGGRLPPAPQRVSAVEALAPEVSALTELFTDGRYLELETAFLMAWNSWAETVANPGDTPGGPPPVGVSAASQRQMRGMDEALRRSTRRGTQFLKDLHPIGNGFPTGLLPGMSQAMVRNKELGQSIRTRNLMAPALQDVWIPLIDHLRTCAGEFARLEGRLHLPDAPRTESLEALLAHTQLRMLERYRHVLWMSSSILAQLASEELPPVLKEL
jgi:hypothetical protein